MDTYINGFGPAIRGTLAVETFPDYKEIAPKRKSSFKRWEKSIIEEKGKRTTFIHKKRHIELLCNFKGGGDWWAGTHAGWYRTSLNNDMHRMFSSKTYIPKGSLFNPRGVPVPVK